MKSTLHLSILCIILFQGLRLAAVSGEACNDYVDKILEDLKEDKEYNMQDPYKIPGKSVKVHTKLGSVNYTGKARIYDCHIYGLSSLHRQGYVVVDRSKKTHYLKVWLAAGELNMKCSGKVRVRGHRPRLTVSGKIDLVNMKLFIIPSSENASPKIRNFKFEDVKRLDIKVSGLGPLEFFLNPYVNFVETVFKNAIRNFVENKLKSFLDKKQYEIPKECIDEAFRRNLM